MKKYDVRVGDVWTSKAGRFAKVKYLEPMGIRTRVFCVLLKTDANASYWIENFVAGRTLTERDGVLVKATHQ